MKTILVVDDEENLRILLEHEFIGMGYHVEMAENGRVALAKIKEKSPDLIILDIMMPEMDGLEALKEVLNEDKKIPVIINSAYSHYKHNFLTWAAENYVVKSSDLTELKAQVRKLLPN
jgi:DNA-binding response OmpR family regulator